MKLIKRVVQQAVTTGTTIVDGVEYLNIIPDLNAKYYFTILLESENKNLGFFDVYDFSGVSGTTIPNINYNVTGNAVSRLYELRKHSQNPNFIDNYYHSTNININGVDLSLSYYDDYPMTIVYYLDTIKYVDYIENSSGDTTTTFYFNKNYPTTDDFLNKPYYKEPSKDMLSGKLKLENNVFIYRPEINIMGRYYNIENINNLSDLKTYVAGNYFIIYKTI